MSYPDYYDKFNWSTFETPATPQLFADRTSLHTLLNAVLCTGYGLTAVTRILTTAGKARIEVSDAPVATEGGLIELAGVPGALAGLNGSHRVQRVGANFVEVNAEVPDGTTGSAGVTVRVPPLGWERAHVSADGSRVAYRSLHPEREGWLLDINLTSATQLQPAIWDSLGADFSGAGRAPSNTFNEPFAASAATSAPRRWVIWGDSQYVALGFQGYMLTEQANNPWWQVLYRWISAGTLADTHATDTNPSMISIVGGTSSASASFAPVQCGLTRPGFVMRGGHPACMSPTRRALSSTGFSSGSWPTTGGASNQVEPLWGLLELAPGHVFSGPSQAAAINYRGKVPGLRIVNTYYPIQADSRLHFQTVAGRKILMLGHCGASASFGNWSLNSTDIGWYGIDIDGWRDA